MAVVSQFAPQQAASNRFRYGVLYVEKKLRMLHAYGYWRQEHTNAVVALLADPSGASFKIVDPATGRLPRALDRVVEVDIALLTQAAQAKFFAAVPWPGEVPSAIATDLYRALEQECRRFLGGRGSLGELLNCLTNRFMDRWPHADRTTAFNILKAKHAEVVAAVTTSKAAVEQAAAEQAAAAAADIVAAEAATAAAATAQKKTWLYVGGGALVVGLGVWVLSRRR